MTDSKFDVVNGLRAAGLAGFLVLSVQTDVWAFGRSAPDYSDGTVTAHSRVGNGSLTTAVRPASRGGWEFQTPAGGWQSCEGDCARTIANKVLDFWDNQSTRSYPGRGLTFRRWY